MTDFTIREASTADVPALARLHVATWNATYPHVSRPPTYELRERQWREAFAAGEANWFCLVVEGADGRLIGFAKGTPSGHPEFGGELSKIYLLGEYQRRGLGTRLLARVARRFLERGVPSMVLFAEPTNPSCAFYEALGAERLPGEAGAFHGGYGWRDLRGLAALCPPDEKP